MFIAQDNAGFTMTFKNGYTVSVRWHPGNSCEHNTYSNPDKFADWWRQPITAQNLELGWESNTAEVAVIRKDKGNKAKDVWFNPLTLKHGDPEGWLSTDEVAGIIQNVQSIKVGVKRGILGLFT